MFYAVYKKSDKNLYSIGSVLADPLDSKYDYVEVEDEVAHAAFDNGIMWDKNTLTFSAIPEDV